MKHKLIMENWRKFLTKEEYTERLPGGLGKTLPSQHHIKLSGDGASEPTPSDIETQGKKCDDCDLFVALMSLVVPEIAFMKNAAAATVAGAKILQKSRESLKGTLSLVAETSKETVERLIRQSGSIANFQKHVVVSQRKMLRGQKLTRLEKEVADLVQWQPHVLKSRGIQTGIHTGAEHGLDSAFNIAKSKFRISNPREDELQTARQMIQNMIGNVF